MDKKNKCKILCIVGPSAVGKSAVIDTLEKRTKFRVQQACSITTRVLRSENDRRISVSMDEFIHMRDSGELIEHIFYDQHAYGISKSVVNAILREGKIPIIDCNLSGLVQVIQNTTDDTDIITVFLVCSAQELYQRQMSRQGNGITFQSRIYRICSALSEIEGAWSPVFQYIIRNGSDNDYDIENAVNKIVRIIEGDTSVESDPFNVLDFKTDMMALLADLSKLQNSKKDTSKEV